MLVSLSCDVNSQPFSYARFKHEPRVFVSKEFTVSELYRSSRYLKDTLVYFSDNNKLFVSTGCFRMTEKKFELSTHSRMPYMSCKVWHFFRDTGTFEYYVSKNYNI